MSQKTATAAITEPKFHCRSQENQATDIAAGGVSSVGLVMVFSLEFCYNAGC
jgi:hypothetical protein